MQALAALVSPVYSLVAHRTHEHRTTDPRYRNWRRSRRALQVVVLAMLAFPLLLSIIDVVRGVEGFYASFGLPAASTLDPNLDSGFRFFAGVFVGFVLICAYAISRIERETTLFRLLVLAVVMGAVARLIAFVTVGHPIAPITWAIGLELLTLPLLPWQAHVARNRPPEGLG
jgi:hypothetical protein